MTITLEGFNITPQSKTSALTQLLQLGYKVDERATFQIDWGDGLRPVHLVGFKETEKPFKPSTFTFLFVEGFPDKGYVLKHDFNSAHGIASSHARGPRPCRCSSR